MVSPTLFIGVVSHSQSTFAVSQGTEGLASKLSTKLTELGLSCEYSVNVLNEFDSSGIVLSDEVFRAGIAEEVRLEGKWIKFLGIKPGMQGYFNHAARWARVQSFRVRKSDQAEIERLINIEYSHMRLMRQGVETGAKWILILEDDAAAHRIKDLAEGLLGIFHSHSIPAYVNLSHSFSVDQLGIRHLLNTLPDIQWQGDTARTIFGASRPATNTVCAILYHRDFLSHLINELEMIPIEPVIPIDWRLNQALMNLWNKGLIGAGDCWFVEPAPIDQLSMRSS